jgi:excinuclease UvrABC helicase subunit UvrB
MSQFKLVSPFQPMGDQVQAIQELVDGLKAGKRNKSYLGELEQEKHLLLLMLSKNIINQRWF